MNYLLPKTAEANNGALEESALKKVSLYPNLGSRKPARNGNKLARVPSYFNKQENMITAAQLRAARGLLDWTRADLAKAANISPETVKNIEHGTFKPQENTAEAIVQAFRARHVEFTDAGVKLVNDAVTVMEGHMPYLQLMQLAYDLMKDNPSEILFMFANNKVSPPEVVEAQKKLREIGCKFRFIVEDMDNFMRYPKEEYRKMPSKFFNHDVVTVFSDRVATLIDKGTQILVVRNDSLAETQRKIFEFIWNNADEAIS